MLCYVVLHLKKRVSYVHSTHCKKIGVDLKRKCISMRVTPGVWLKFHSLFSSLALYFSVHLQITKHHTETSPRASCVPATGHKDTHTNTRKEYQTGDEKGNQSESLGLISLRPISGKGFGVWMRRGRQRGEGGVLLRS